MDNEKPINNESQSGPFLIHRVSSEAPEFTHCF